MKVGDIVKMKKGYSILGIIIRIDREHYGSRQSYKVVGAKRGETLQPKMVNCISPTKDGIRDRVMILWPDHGYTYEESTKLEVISEGG